MFLSNNNVLLHAVMNKYFTNLRHTKARHAWLAHALHNELDKQMHTVNLFELTDLNKKLKFEYTCQWYKVPRWIQVHIQSSMSRLYGRRLVGRDRGHMCYCSLIQNTQSCRLLKQLNTPWNYVYTNNKTKIIESRKLFN